MGIQWVLCHLANTIWLVQDILVNEEVFNLPTYTCTLYTAFMDVFSESLTDISKFELEFMTC